MKNKAIYFSLATALATAAFPATCSLAADSSSTQQQQMNSTEPNGVNTGLKTRNPATNAAGVNGLPGNKSGKSTDPNSASTGSSSGEQGSQDKTNSRQQ